ncbi:short-chain dehydrogenase [Winogradskyella sp. PAMC22761]|nr:short-chain dehydrogenase [Winogradskyella sp. PAMC22761]
MKKIILLLLLILINCSNKDQTDKALLEKDKKMLVENLDAGKVAGYKFGKILIRAAAKKDSTFYSLEGDEIDAENFIDFKSTLNNTFQKVEKVSKNKELSVLDYISIYRDYKKMETFIMETDEDLFPTLAESINEIYGDTSKIQPRLKGIKKKEAEAFEHAALSAIVLLSKDLGKEVALYECSKTEPKFLPDSEFKTLIQFFRGFIFFEKKLFYLSEDEITRNINWLDANKNIDLPLTRSMFKWGNLDNKKTHIGFHSINHLFRGFDRLMMDRAIDEKRALEDFEIFLSDSKKLGVDNELIWSVETYLYLKNEENEKAIIALQKLKTSSFLISNDKKNIDQSITYLKNREPDKVLNGFYDKYFLSKIATKYIFSILSSINWERILIENDVKHTKEIFEMIETLNNLSKKIDNQLSGKTINEASKAIKETGNSFFNTAKDLLNNE